MLFLLPDTTISVADTLKDRQGQALLSTPTFTMQGFGNRLNG